MRALPIEMQRMAMTYEMRSAIEVRDFAVATRVLNEFETMGIPAEEAAEIQVLSGRLYESLGRKEDALTAYRAAAASRDRRAAAQGRLREIELLNATGDMPRNEVIHQLESLTTAWRGDETESGGLRLLARLYTEENRYRDAFQVMRTALLAHPNSDMTRKIQDEAARTFDRLFLAGKGDSMPPIEALGLFYDFRELTPIGRRGDEMIRRLADRLVSVDLLDQAAELLQHQVDNRLQRRARAQVATRLAVVYLMNRKPDRAHAVLRATRTADLSNELREQRLLLEARALSDSGRHELALEVIANITGREAIRLRSDILWAAKRWRDAAEQIELMFGNRWRDFTPLTDNRARRHHARRNRLCDGRRATRPVAAPREICGQVRRWAGPARLRRRLNAGRLPAARNSRTSPARRSTPIRWKVSCAICARAIPTRRCRKATPRTGQGCAGRGQGCQDSGRGGQAAGAGEVRTHRAGRCRAAETAGRRAAQARQGADRIDFTQAVQAAHAADLRRPPLIWYGLSMGRSSGPASRRPGSSRPPARKRSA